MVKYLIAVFLSLVLIGTTACQPKTGQTGKVSGGVIQVVAAENFWGSIAAQLGGTHVNVISIVTDPNADPHEFETNTADALDFAHANYVILNANSPGAAESKAAPSWNLRSQYSARTISLELDSRENRSASAPNLTTQAQSSGTKRE